MQSSPRIYLLTTTIAKANLVASRYLVCFSIVIYISLCVSLLSSYLFVIPHKQSRQSESLTKVAKMSSPPPKDEDESEDEEEEDDEQGAVCGACGDSYGTDEFWICCDACEKWFHGKCVKITPAKAEHIKHYKCPSCSNKRARP